MIKLSVSQMLLSNIHVGNTTRFLNVKIKPYLFGRRGSVYLFNISTTYVQLKLFLTLLINLVSRRRKVLIVKDRDFYNFQSLLNIRHTYYYYKKWIGGSLTNFRKVRKSPKFKVDNNFYFGLGAMRYIPSLVFFFNPNLSHWALKESVNLDLPIASIINANSAYSTFITYPIGGNNQSFEALYLYTFLIKNALVKGRQKEKLKILRLI
jgi:small subunit ribosomal protein S2